MRRRRWIKYRPSRRSLALVVMLGLTLSSILVLVLNKGSSSFSSDWLRMLRRSPQQERDVTVLSPNSFPNGTEATVRKNTSHEPFEENTDKSRREQQQQPVEPPPTPPPPPAPSPPPAPVPPLPLHHHHHTDDEQHEGQTSKNQVAKNLEVAKPPPLPPPAAMPPPHLDPQKDEFPFSYLINEPDFCRNSLKIINVIPIAPTSDSARHRIRNLWGRQEVSELTNIQPIFFLGLTSSSQLQANISEESLAHHDIIQLNFVDSYRNLTLKTLSMLHWSLTYCPHAKWILKSDEDVFINPFAVSTYIMNNANCNFICSMKYGSKVCRAERRCPSKWAVTLDEYQYDYYPRYCLGSAYGVSLRMAAKLYAAANKTHPLSIEDAYFTGVIAKPLQPKYKAIPYSRFPRGKFFSIDEALWNGQILFRRYLHRNMTNLNLVWRKIFESQGLYKKLKNLEKV